MKKILIGLVLGLMLVPSLVFASFDVNLKYGAKGDVVKELQDFLIEQGVMTGNSTGNFYSVTLRAVKAFQTANNLPSTGFFGSMSRARANQLLALSDTAEQAETGTITPPVVQVAQVQDTATQQQIAALNAQVALLNQQAQTQTQYQQQIATNTTPIPIPIPVPENHQYSISSKVAYSNDAGVLSYREDNTLRKWYYSQEFGSETANGAIELKVLDNGIPIDLTNNILETSSTVPNTEMSTLVITTAQKVSENYIENGVQKTRNYSKITGLPNGAVTNHAPFGNYTITFTIPSLNLSQTVPLVVELLPN